MYTEDEVLSKLKLLKHMAALAHTQAPRNYKHYVSLIIGEHFWASIQEAYESVGVLIERDDEGNAESLMGLTVIVADMEEDWILMAPIGIGIDMEHNHRIPDGENTSVH